MDFQTAMKNKKGILYFVLIIILLGVIGIGISRYQKKTDVELVKLKNIKYEVLDESVLTEDLLNRWINANKKVQGIYETSDDKYTFVLIAGGEKDATGYGIALNGVEGTNEEVKIKYKVMAPENPELSKKEKQYPLMVIRYDKDSRKAVGEYMKDIK